MATKSTAVKTIDEYVAGFPKEVQDILEKCRRTIKTAAPGAEEAMKYGIPTFTMNGDLVHFAAFAHHIGFYPTPSGIERFKKELSEYVWAKGSVQFPLDRPIPYDLITRIVKFRVQENLDREKKRPRPVEKS